MQLSKKTKPTLLALVKQSDYKHSDVIRHYGNMSLQTALASKTPSIGRLTKLEDRTAIVEGVAAIFMATAMYFDGELPANKAKLIVEDLLIDYEYSNLKLEDILAICKELKEQAVYTKLTPSKILKQVADYCKRREKQAIANSINASLDEKQEANIDERIRRSVRHIEDSNRIISEKNVKVKKKYYR